MSIMSSIQSFGQAFRGSAANHEKMKLPAEQLKELRGEANKFMQVNQPGKSFDVGAIRETLGSTGLQQRPEVRPVISTGSPTFSGILDKMVHEVDSAQKSASAQAKSVMLGQTDNLHQSVIAMNEASVAFTLMVEVRNKLVEAYQELMRMQV